VQEKGVLEILLVEDNEGDIELTLAAFEEAHIDHTLHIVNDGEQALDFMNGCGLFQGCSRPHVVLLDLNLPKINGREVLERMKNDDSLKSIPVIVLTSSNAERDILESYNLKADCYIVKPVDWKKFVETIKGLNIFWDTIASLPS
jgi:CheY-like chemotaxis protein